MAQITLERAYHFVMNGDDQNFTGSLNDGKILSTIPDLASKSKDDFSTKGRLIPASAQDQLNASICNWFWVDDQLISLIPPNLSSFAMIPGDVSSAYL